MDRRRFIDWICGATVVAQLKPAEKITDRDAEFVSARTYTPIDTATLTTMLARARIGILSANEIRARESR